MEKVSWYIISIFIRHIVTINHFCKSEKLHLFLPWFILDGEEILATKGDFNEGNVHDQSGISFKTPPYPDLEITEPVKVLSPCPQGYSIQWFNRGIYFLHVFTRIRYKTIVML